MSDATNDGLNSAIRLIEEIIGRPLNAIQRLEFEKAFAESANGRDRAARELAALRELTMSPIEKRLRAIAFRKRLKARQGSISPDFEALYKKKAELDRKLLHDDEK